MSTTTEIFEVHQPSDAQSSNSPQPLTALRADATDGGTVNRLPSPEKPRGRSYVQRPSVWITSIIAVQTVMMLLGFVHPLMELAAHFSMHMLVIATAFLPYCLWRRRWQQSTLVLLCVAILLSVVRPWELMPTTAEGASPPGKTSLKVMSWNVLTTNHAFDAVQKLVQDQVPDVLVFIEVRPNLLQELPEVTNAYPYHEVRSSWGGEGIAILSKFPIEQFEWQDFGYAKQPALVATIRKSDVRQTNELEVGMSEEGGRLKLVGLHTLSPLPVYRARTRDTQLRLLLEWSQSQDVPLCVCGDFNITPWTAPFQALLREGFEDSRVGSANGASWPSPMGWFGIPIDHAITKGDCRVTDRQVLSASPGSDHKPLVFTVEF